MKKKILSIILVIFMVIPVFPVTVSALGDSFSTISTGLDHMMAVKNDGSLWAWGRNEGGQLGDGTTTNTLIPVKIMDDVIQVSAGYKYTMAIKSDKSLWTWGCKFNVLREGTIPIYETRPVKIMDDVVQVSAGGCCTMAVKSDGSLWGWGYNYAGQLGDGTTIDRDKPVKIMDDVIQVSLSPYEHTMAIKSDGSLWGWGYNGNGQLGDGTREAKHSPVKIMDDVIQVTTGFYQTMAIKGDGSLWGWGYNGFGQLGDGTSITKINPVKIMDDVVQISMGDYHSAAVKSDGSLWTWGMNQFGQLGDGTIINSWKKGSPAPKKIMDNVACVSLGGIGGAMALKNNGTLWGWGAQLQDCFTAEVVNPSPFKIMDGVKTPDFAAIPKPVIVPPGDGPSDFDNKTASTAVATPTASNVIVNGKNTAFDAYNINGSNYFKLRDLAYALNGTAKQFEVGFDGTKNAISLTSGKPYTKVGGEMTGKSSGGRTAAPTSSKIYLDGKEVNLTAYNIDGNNYFKLRDIGQAFNFGVTWDGARNTIAIDTGIGYTPE